MKLTLSIAALFLFTLTGATAQQKAPPVPAPRTNVLSPAHVAVARHLDQNGFLYSVFDLDSHLLTRLTNNALEAAGSSALFGDLDPATMLNTFGLSCIKSIGVSSSKTGGLYHNRTLLYMPGGSEGIVKALGGKNSPFRVLNMAPMGTDLIFEQEFSMSAILSAMDSLEHSAGESSITASWQTVLSQPIPMPGATLTVGDLLKKFDTRFTGIVRLRDDQQIHMPGGGSIPGFDAMFSADRMGFFFELLLKGINDNSPARVINGSGGTMIRMKTELPGGAVPAIYHEVKTDRVYIASHPDFLNTCFKSAGAISKDPAFARATANLPKQGQGLVYTTPKILPWFHKFLSKLDPTASASLKRIGLFETPKAAVASVRTNVPEGALFLSTDTDNHLDTLVKAFAFARGATGLTGDASLDIAALAATKEILPPDDFSSPKQQVLDNLLQISLAATSYFSVEPTAKDITYRKLVSDDYLFEIKPVVNESYQDLTLQRGGGSLTLTMADGQTVAHTYPAAIQ